MPNRAIIFDCDGVLINSEAIYIETEMAALAALGLHYDPGVYQTRFVGLPDIDFVAALRADYAELGKGALPADFLDKTRARCWQRFETELKATDGLTDFLDAHGAAHAVASSSNLDPLNQKLTMTGLKPYFAPHIYSGAQVPNGKPAPDLFLFAAERLQRAPRDCIVIEDSANGIKAGRAAGMDVWGFTGGGHGDEGSADRLRSAGAHFVLDSFPAVQSHHRTFETPISK
ncbi:MAG: HAD family hydrolase [Alphaproteobacteria bacterium]